MSFHGVAPGHAIVIESPTQLQITPMQIDTWNREAMNISHTPCPYVAGPLPRAALSPPGSRYSGLLECPITTRISKVVEGGYRVRAFGQCAAAIETPSECFAAAQQTVQGGPGATFAHQTVHNGSLPRGCTITTGPTALGAHTIIFNEAQNSSVPCASGTTLQGGAASSLVNMSLRLDAAAAEATITLTGPANVWFGVGFNASRMSDAPWTIVVEGGDQGAVSEHRLGDHLPGTVLSPSLTVVHTSVTQGRRTVTLRRPLKVTGPSAQQYYQFETETADTTINFINALGTSATFVAHQEHEPASITLSSINGVGKCQWAQRGRDPPFPCARNSVPFEYGGSQAKPFVHSQAPVYVQSTLPPLAKVPAPLPTTPPPRPLIQARDLPGLRSSAVPNQPPTCSRKRIQPVIYARIRAV